MRWVCVFVASLLLTAAFPVVATSSKGVITCSNSNLDSLPSNWSLSDQSCLRVDLGVLAPGDSLFFEISASSEVDILLFPSNTVSVYQNEQSYRMDSVWISESVFESFSGEGEWHWNVPSDRDSTRWFLVVDNMAHPQDSGEGAQGGQNSELILDGGLISPEQFTLSDSIHRIAPGEYSVVHGPFSVDEGTFVRIHARTMVGEPDIFVMTESAFSYYSPSSNWSSSLRIVSADMLLVTNERNLSWEATDTNGEGLYIVVDNRPGPGGGGAGTFNAAVTVTVTLIPILSPSISSESNLDSVDVGEVVTLSASGTPNQSGQIPSTGFYWDVDSDGISDWNGVTTEQTWDEPGNYPVRLSVTSIDSRSASKSTTVIVSDMSPPEISMEISGEITKGFGEELSISATFSDNWGVDSIDWLLDGEIILSNYSISELTSTLSLQVSNGYSQGQHTISLVVTDKSGLSTQRDTTANFIDISAPELSPFVSQIEVKTGVPTILQILAQDNQSVDLDYTWTFEQGTENEIQFKGPQVIYQQVTYVFNSEGPTNVVCKVENDAGLSSYAEILVIVKEGETNNVLTWQIIAVISLLILALLSVSAIFFYNYSVNRRMSELSEEEEMEESPPEPPSPQTQAQMWSRSQPPSFQPPQDLSPAPPPGDEMFDILSVDRPSQVSTSNQNQQEDSRLGELESHSETSSEVDSGIRTATKSCSACSKKFEITMPEGLDSAYTNCPHCGSEEMVSIL